MTPETTKTLFQINTEKALFEMSTEVMCLRHEVKTMQRTKETGDAFSQLDDVSSRRLACIIFLMVSQIRTFFLVYAINYDFIPVWVQFIVRLVVLGWGIWDFFDFKKEMGHLDEVRKVAIRRIRWIYGYGNEQEKELANGSNDNKPSA